MYVCVKGECHPHPTVIKLLQVQELTPIPIQGAVRLPDEH